MKTVAQQNTNTNGPLKQVDETNEKIVFNKESKMVFSKIDFTGVGKEKHKKQRTNPEVMLKNLQKSKSKLKEMEESGETSKAKRLKEKQMWLTALDKSEGVKVKDDEGLLKRTIRKENEIKNRSKKKWDMRKKTTEKMKDDRQKRRQENIAAKKKEKKDKKFKKITKKGRFTF